MKTKLILLSLVVITVGTAIALTLLSRSQAQPSESNASAQHYEVRGVVRSVDAANLSLRIAHEEIPDYMPAMTMPFNVRSRELLSDLQPGDRVQFELTVTGDDSWISRMTRVSGDRVAAGQNSGEDREADRVQTGEPVPEFTLLDQDGGAVRLSDFRGKAVVLTFVYTRCPIPNFCPLMSKNFAELQERLGKAFPGKTALLSVSIDPQFDRPEILKTYAARYQADHRQWTFATGTDGQVNFVAGLFGLFHEPENGLISHDLRTALIGPDGRLVHLWKSNAWTPYEVHRMVDETLKAWDFVSAR